MSFKSLVNKLMKEGKSKEAATKIAGKIANEKLKGAGSGPTSKQKARMKKSPSKKKCGSPVNNKGTKIVGREPNKSKSFTDKKGNKLELNTYNRRTFNRTTDPNATKETRRASSTKNTVELKKTKPSGKTKVKRADGGTAKSQRLTRQFSRKAGKPGGTTVEVTRKSKSPTTMKKSPSKMARTIERKLTTKKPSKVDKLQARKTKAIIEGKENKARRLDKKQNKAAGLSSKVDKLQSKKTKAMIEGKENKARRLDKKQSKAAGLSPTTMKKSMAKVKGADMNVPAEKLNYIQKSSAKMMKSPSKKYGSPNKMSGESYDMKQAYNKNLTKSARFNYLKNAMHDKKGGSVLSKHMKSN